MKKNQEIDHVQIACFTYDLSNGSFTLIDVKFDSILNQ